MNNENPIIVGLDIGTTKIAVIAGRKKRVWQTRDFRIWQGQFQWCKTWASA